MMGCEDAEREQKRKQDMGVFHGGSFQTASYRWRRHRCFVSKIG
jgi:hypothetical protein